MKPHVTLCDFIFLPVSVEGFWVGGRHLGSGVWEWVTGTCDWHFNNWGTYYHGGTADCSTIGDAWAWNDYTCGNVNGYICQFD